MTDNAVTYVPVFSSKKVFEVGDIRDAKIKSGTGADRLSLTGNFGKTQAESTNK
ncbi:hypothetical protein LJB76_02670 [Clostridia bacterium OttesenSCG-928-O13]|nr:hypothetical protein [Clostridia bacterium OttesenSCG-928-O13]